MASPEFENRAGGLFEGMSFEGKSFEEIRREMDAFVLQGFAAPAGVLVTEGQCGGVPGRWVSVAPGSGSAGDGAADDGAKAAPRSAVLYIHGGGFTLGSSAGVLPFLTELAARLGAAAFAPDYRMAPEHPFPAAPDDCFAAYRGLLEEGFAPADILLAGESAGGNLAPALLARLKRLGKPLPRKMILFSPAADLTMTAPSLKANVGKDRFFPNGLGSADYYCDPKDQRNPEASPLFADFAGFPDTYLCADDTEVLCSDTLALAARMHAAGVRVRAHLYHGLIHGFPLEVPDIPESREVYEEIREFF